MKRRSFFCMLSAVPRLYCMAVSAQEPSKPTEGDFAVPEFHFKSGEVLKDMRLHYTTYGNAARDARAGHQCGYLIRALSTPAGHGTYL